MGKIECAWRLLPEVMLKIVEAEGGNNFKLPHSGVRKQMKADGWNWVD